MPLIKEIDGVITKVETGKVYRCESPADLAALFDLLIFGDK